MRRWSAAQLALTLAISLALWAVLAAACMCVGSLGGVGWPASATVRTVRMESVLVASLVGAALAAGGVVYQAILRNPLADPYLLGISSGSSLYAYLWQLPFLSTLLSSDIGLALGQQVFAFFGAAVSVAVVFTIASRRGRIEPVTLLLVGVIVNAINASIFLLVNEIVKDPARTGGPLSVLVGGLPTALTRDQAWTAGICIAAGWILLASIGGELNVAGLSESEAQSLGVRIHRMRWFALILASIITASAVAISGPIGFVGLICPHIARLIVGRDQRRVLPLATALGAALLALADASSRWLAQSQIGTSLPVGVLTGLLGGPFFLLLLWRRRGEVRIT